MSIANRDLCDYHVFPSNISEEQPTEYCLNFALAVWYRRNAACSFGKIFSNGGQLWDEQSANVKMP